MQELRTDERRWMNNYTLGAISFRVRSREQSFAHLTTTITLGQMPTQKKHATQPAKYDCHAATKKYSDHSGTDITWHTNKKMRPREVSIQNKEQTYRKKPEIQRELAKC